MEKKNLIDNQNFEYSLAALGEAAQTDNETALYLQERLNGVSIARMVSWRVEKISAEEVLAEALALLVDWQLTHYQRDEAVERAAAAIRNVINGDENA